MSNRIVDQALLDESIHHLLESTTNPSRDMRIADRLEMLFSDSIEDKQDILADALTRLIDMLITYGSFTNPTHITCTPDSTLKIGWNGKPEGFVRTSIEFPSGNAVTICNGVIAEWNLYEYEEE